MTTFVSHKPEVTLVLAALGAPGLFNPTWITFLYYLILIPPAVVHCWDIVIKPIYNFLKDRLNGK